ERPDLIIPGRDDDVVLLAKLAATDPLFAGRVLAGTRPVCQILRNKLAVARFAQSLGLPFVETLSTGEFQIDAHARSFVAMHGWPLLIKPEEGQGSQEVWLIDNLERLELW